MADGTVRILMARIFPYDSGYMRTVSGRRKRLRAALEAWAGMTLFRVSGSYAAVQPAAAALQAEPPLFFFRKYFRNIVNRWAKAGFRFRALI